MILLRFAPYAFSQDDADETTSEAKYSSEKRPHNYDTGFGWGVLPFLLDAEWMYRTNFDDAVWHGGAIAMRFSVDPDMPEEISYYQPMIQAAFEMGIVDKVDESRFSVSAGIFWGHDFGIHGGSGMPGFGDGEKSFPMTRSNPISMGLAVCAGYFTFTGNTSNKETANGLTIDHLIRLGGAYVEVNFRHSFRIQFRDSMSVRSDLYIGAHIGRPKWPIALTVGYTWLNTQVGEDGYLEVSVRIAL